MSSQLLTCVALAPAATVAATCTASLPVTTGSLEPTSLLAPRFTDVQITSDIPYAIVKDFKGHAVTLHLDVYAPAGDTAAHRPVILWIHGGGFRTGIDRTQRYIVNYATAFAKRGCVCFAIDYRLRAAADMAAPDAKYSALVDAVHDAYAALNWIRTRCDEYGGDPGRILVAGGSAGGQTAVNLALYEGEPGQRWNTNGLVALACLWGGPEPEYRMFQSVKADAPPTIFIHGTADRLVPFAASQDIYNQLVAAGATAELHPIQDAAHTPTGEATDPMIVDWIAKFFAQALAKATR